MIEHNDMTGLSLKKWIDNKLILAFIKWKI